MKPNILSNNRTNWSSNKKTVSQPNGINYKQLFNDIHRNDKQNKTENVINRKDLRKMSSPNDSYSKDLEKNDEINKLDKGSIIPIPGVMFDDIENNGNYSGKSGNWNDVNNNQLTNGPQWNPMTF